MQLLLAEDDQILASGLGSLLSGAGFTVKHAPNGPVAEYLLTTEDYDIAILDLGLPMLDGLAVLKKVRQSRPTLPVVVLTALDQLDSRVTSLNAGADDYVLKPFDFPELLARLNAVLRRSRQGTASAELLAGNLRFDRASRRALIHASPVDLTRREAILLDLLMTQIDKVVTKDQIAKAWSDDGNEVGAGNTAEVHVHRLRRKIDNSGLVIRTIRGLGYLLEAGSSNEQPA
jgi:two-component system, OmpR family, response regulator